MTTLALTSLPLADSWNMHDSWGWGWMMPMMLGMALFWGAIILGFAWLVRDGIGRRQGRHQETALTILDRRSAQGALSPDEYHQRRNVLTDAAAEQPDKSVISSAIDL